MRPIAAALLLLLVPIGPNVQERTPAVEMPNDNGTLKFAVLGGFGTGDEAQHDLARQMAQVRQRFPFELVLTVGGNIYGEQRPKDFQTKFELPYQPLLEAGVVFRASLGQQDDPNQRYYKLFNMNGNPYYSFKAPVQSVRFFALQSTSADPKQAQWLEQELTNATEDWKIVYSERMMLEPLLVSHKVNVVFSGRDHVYERLAPRNGMVQFVAGSGGKVDKGAEQTFLIAEIAGDRLTFNAISRSGHVVDSGTISRR